MKNLSMGSILGYCWLFTGVFIFLLSPIMLVEKYDNPWLFFLYFASWIPGGFCILLGFILSDESDELLKVKKENK